MIDYPLLIAMLQDMSGPRTRRGYDLPHYWTVTRKAAEALEELQAELARLRSSENV